jgi:hypothetical protein
MDLIAAQQVQESVRVQVGLLVLLHFALATITILAESFRLASAQHLLSTIPLWLVDNFYKGVKS